MNDETKSAGEPQDQPEDAQGRGNSEGDGDNCTENPDLNELVSQLLEPENFQRIVEVLKEIVPVRARLKESELKERARIARIHAFWKYSITLLSVLVFLIGIILFRHDTETVRLIIFSMLAFLGGTAISPNMRLPSVGSR